LDFFTPEREHFFRPLTWGRRELVAASLKALHEALYGTAAAQAAPMTRERLRALFIGVVRARDWSKVVTLDADEEGAIELADEMKVASALIRDLEAHGWLESDSDRVTLERVFRFSRPGKHVAAALAQLDRPRSKTRQRNMRSAKGHLAAFVQASDPDDLLDAWDYACRVTADLQEDIEYFAGLVRGLARDAMERRLAWDEFADFLDNRFRSEFAARLVADNAERHRDEILSLLDDIRRMSQQKLADTDAQLLQRAPWLTSEEIHGRPLSWLLRQIEAAVDSACERKLPELRTAMRNYINRFTSLLRQVMAMETSFGVSALGRMCDAVKQADPVRQEQLLDILAARLGTARVRLIDPQTLKVDAPSARRRASALLTPPTMTIADRLAAAERRAAAAAFDFTTDEILAVLDRALVLKPRGVRISELPQKTAREALYAMHAFGAVHGAEARHRFNVERLEQRASTPTFETQDIIIGHRS
jgi:hypothetical protein